MDAEAYVKLKKQVEKLNREADRSEGAREQLLGQLKKEEDCDSLEEGRKLLEEITKEQQEADKKFSVALTSFQKRWGEVLDG